MLIGKKLTDRASVSETGAVTRERAGRMTSCHSDRWLYCLHHQSCLCHSVMSVSLCPVCVTLSCVCVTQLLTSTVIFSQAALSDDVSSVIPRHVGQDASLTQTLLAVGLCHQDSSCYLQCDTVTHCHQDVTCGMTLSSRRYLQCDTVTKTLPAA